jgi:hypothetical protein
MLVIGALSWTGVAITLIHDPYDSDMVRVGVLVGIGLFSALCGIILLALHGKSD